MEADFEELHWINDFEKKRLGVVPGLIAVRTARPMDVPVQVEVRRHAPKNDFSKWDAVVETGIIVPSGVLFVTGSSEQFGKRIEVTCGCYASRVYFGGLGTLTSHLEGKDYYKIVLWPIFEYSVRVIKRWKAPRQYRGKTGNA